MKAWEGKSMGRVTPGASYLAHWRLSEGGAWRVGQPGSLAQCSLAVWFFAMGAFEVGALAVKSAYITIKKPTCQALTLVRETENKEKLIYQCEVTKIILRAHCDTHAQYYTQVKCNLKTTLFSDKHFVSLSSGSFFHISVFILFPSQVSGLVFNYILGCILFILLVTYQMKQ